jgi:general secretion pathway protein G
MQLRRTTRQVTRRGFTLMEILVVVAIIVVLAGVGIVYLLPKVDEAREGVAKGQIKAISNACEMYKLSNGDWPVTIEALTEMQPNGAPPLLKADAIVDPWGNPYGYDPSGQNNGGMLPDISVQCPSGKILGNWPGGSI